MNLDIYACDDVNRNMYLEFFTPLNKNDGDSSVISIELLFDRQMSFKTKVMQIKRQSNLGYTHHIFEAFIWLFGIGIIINFFFPLLVDLKMVYFRSEL